MNNSRPRLNKFSRDTAFLQVSTFIAHGANAAASILIARVLLPEGYGLYALVFSLYAVMMILGNWGVQTATVNFLARALAQKDSDEIRNVLGFFLRLSLYIYVGLLVVGGALSPVIATYFYGDVKLGILAAPLFIVPLGSLMFEFLRVVLLTLRDIKTLGFLEAFKEVIKVAFYAGALLCGWGVAGIVWANVINALLFSVIAVLVFNWARQNVFKQLPPLSLLLKGVFRHPIRPYIGTGLVFAVDKNMTRIYENVPLILLSRLADSTEAGFFRLSLSLVQVPVFLFNAISRNLLTTLSRIMGQGDRSKLKQIYLRISRNAAVFTLVVSLIFLPLIAPLIKFLYGPAFAPAISYSYILLISIAVMGVGLGVDTIFLILKRLRIMLAIKIALLIPLLLCGYLLILRLGGLGAAWFYTLYTAGFTLFFFWLSARLLRKIFSQD